MYSPKRGAPQSNDAGFKRKVMMLLLTQSTSGYERVPTIKAVFYSFLHLILIFQ
jgi:hypothetical protein